MAMPVSEGVLGPISLVALLLAVGLSFFVLARYSSRGSPFAVLRERFVLGVPWGTLIVIAGVAAVYYLVQGGGRSDGPIVTAFRSWSLFYPQGLLFSSFSHASESHLTSNLLGTVAFAPIVEYAWGHYARDETGVSHPWLARPAGRIGAFVGMVVLVGLLGSLFVPGAIIGFSGVVFAFAGFALVVRPLITVMAMLALQVLRLVRNAIQDPVVTATARPRFVSPSWADVALQGHLLGVVLGVVLALAFLRYRNERPEILYVWFAALVFAVSRSLHAIYWYLGADSYVLYQAIGTAGVFVLALVVGLAVFAVTNDHETRWLPGTAAIGVLVLVLGLIAIGGLLYNVTSVETDGNPQQGIEVGDYIVIYAQDVEDQYISAVRIPFVDPISVEVSGVIVTSDDRNIWELTMSANRLAFEGEARIPVGDATWRETVYVNRTAWTVLGGNETYKVFGAKDGSTASDRQLLFESDPAQADLKLNGSTISIRPTEEFYAIELRRNGTVLDTVSIPGHNESVSIEDITFERNDNELLARHGGTELTVAEYHLAED